MPDFYSVSQSTRDVFNSLRAGEAFDRSMEEGLDLLKARVAAAAESLNTVQRPEDDFSDALDVLVEGSFKEVTDHIAYQFNNIGTNLGIAASYMLDLNAFGYGDIVNPYANTPNYFGSLISKGGEWIEMILPQVEIIETNISDTDPNTDFITSDAAASISDAIDELVAILIEAAETCASEAQHLSTAQSDLLLMARSHALKSNFRNEVGKTVLEAIGTETLVTALNK